MILEQSSKYSRGKKKQSAFFAGTGKENKIIREKRSFFSGGPDDGEWISAIRCMQFSWIQWGGREMRRMKKIMRGGEAFRTFKEEGEGGGTAWRLQSIPLYFHVYSVWSAFHCWSRVEMSRRARFKRHWTSFHIPRLPLALKDVG